MTEPFGNWIFTLAISAGLMSAPSAGPAGPRDADLEFGSICHARLEPAAEDVFHGVGIVTAIDSQSGALTLDHEDIIGLMPAMEMMYRVETRAISRGLRLGDRVGFDLDGKTYTILGVKLISPSQ